MNKGDELLKVLKLQRSSFIRTLDGKLITNPLLYQRCEDESERLQKLISRENIKEVKKECDRRGVPYPDFRREKLSLER